MNGGQSAPSEMDQQVKTESSINGGTDNQTEKHDEETPDYLLPHASLLGKSYMKPPARRKSLWWQAFHLTTDMKVAVCNVCGGKLNVTHNSTSPLRNHLQIKHPPVFDALLSQTEAASGLEEVVSETFRHRKDTNIMSLSNHSSAKRIKMSASSHISAATSTTHNNNSSSNAHATTVKMNAVRAIDRHLAMFLIQHNLPIEETLSSVTFQKLLDATAQAGRAGLSITTTSTPLNVAHVQQTLSGVESVLRSALSDTWRTSKTCVALACEEWKLRDRPFAAAADNNTVSSLAFLHARWIDQNFHLHAAVLKVYPHHHHHHHNNNNNNNTATESPATDSDTLVWADLAYQLHRYGLSFRSNDDNNSNEIPAAISQASYLTLGVLSPLTESVVQRLDDNQLHPLYDVDDMLQTLVEEVVYNNSIWEMSGNETNISFALANDGFPEYLAKDSSERMASALLAKARGLFVQWSKIRGSGETSSLNSKHCHILALLPKWWATYSIMEALLAMKMEMEQNERWMAHAIKLQPSEWKRLENLKRLLTPLTCLAESLRGCTQITVSLLPLLLGAARHELTNFNCDTDAVNRIAEAMAQRFDELFGRIDAPYHEEGEEEEGLPAGIVFAHALDPRFKDLPLVTDASNREEVWAGLLREMEKVAVQEGDDSPDTTTNNNINNNNNTATPAPANTGAGSRSSFFARIHSLQVARRQPKSTDALLPQINNELAAYQTAARMDYNPECMTDSNPLEWWKTHHLRFPTLWKLARRYLALPVTTAPAHRAFDIKGHLALEQQTQTSEWLLERVLVNENMDFLSNISWDVQDEKVEASRTG